MGACATRGPDHPASAALGWCTLREPRLLPHLLGALSPRAVAHSGQLLWCTLHHCCHPGCQSRIQYRKRGLTRRGRGSAYDHASCMAVKRGVQSVARNAWAATGSIPPCITRVSATHGTACSATGATTVVATASAKRWAEMAWWLPGRSSTGKIDMSALKACNFVRLYQAC